MSWRAPLRRAWLASFPRSFLLHAQPDDRELGLAGESLAARELARNGFTILGRRVRTSAGEVDVLAREAGVVVCVEVKSGRIESVPRPRGSPTAPHVLDRWRAGLRLGDVQRTRLARAARLLADGAPARVDLYEILVDRRARRVICTHVRGSARIRKGFPRP